MTEEELLKRERKLKGDEDMIRVMFVANACVFLVFLFAAGLFLGWLIWG